MDTTTKKDTFKKHELKKDGFTNQRLTVVPKQVLEHQISHPLTSPLYLTDIGYFPKASHHYRIREDGCDHYILILCVDGSGTIHLPHTSVTLEKHNLVFIEANVPHTYYASSTTPWSIYWLHFNGSNALAFTSTIMKSSTLLTLSPDISSQFILQFNTLYALLQKGYLMDNMIQTSCILTSMFGLLINTGSNSVSPHKSSYHLVNECIAFMRDHLDETLTLDSLASHLNLSKSYLTNFFKEHTGFSPIDYFIQLKMQRACQLLDTTNLTIKEIAYQIGYTDPYYFSRIFKKSISYSPKHYRDIKKG